MKLPARSEHEDQVAVFQWAALYEHRWPALALLFAVPNGGHRHIVVAKKMKKEGVKAGVPDMFLPVALGGYHGLFIEMKRFDGKNPRGGQETWLRNLAAGDYAVFLCRGSKAATDVLEAYLKGEIRKGSNG